MLYCLELEEGGVESRSGPGVIIFPPPRTSLGED